MSATGESLRAMSDSRNWYARQSQMTVFGTVPSLQDVQQNFSDCLAMAVGITSNVGGVLGVNVVAREAANNHEARCSASTLLPRREARNQPVSVK